MNPIQIVIADDHPIVRQGLSKMIEADPQLKIVAEAGDGLNALQAIVQHQPQIAILDVDMPHLDGFGVAREIAEQRLATRIIFLTIHSEEELSQAAMELGVCGYVLKDRAVEEIITAIKAVAEGRRFTSLPMTTSIGKERAHESERERLGLNSLTPTELRVVQLLAEYQTSKEIADALSISARTVDTHRNNISRKLQLQGNHALLKFAVKHKNLL